MFILTVCQVGAEPALKNEIARLHPGLRFSYSRPGFVTFKVAEGEWGLRDDLGSVFARAYALSLGKAMAKNPAEASKLPEMILAGIEKIPAELRNRKRAIRLHVWERDRQMPGEEPPGFVPHARAEAMERALREHSAGAQFAPDRRAELGDLVFDVIEVEENEWWTGYHVHTTDHHPHPGGNPRLTLPPDAPSRAYVKLEEALIWSDAPISPGELAVEIGSAPGGASLALLRRGINVVGIDPADMDPKVALFREGPAKFRHIHTSVQYLRREDLPNSIQWVLLDMNVSPNVTLNAVDRLVSRMKDTLLGVILTIKLNKWSIAEEIPEILQAIEGMGMVRVRATQLASNRQEIVVYGLTRKGQLKAQAQKEAKP